MTKTLAALEKFMQELEPAAPPAAPLRYAALADPDTPLKPADPYYPGSLQPTARAADIKVAAAKARQQTVMESAGVTRRGRHGEWHRLLGMAVLALTIGFGFRLVVRVGGWAGETYWRQGTGSSRPQAATLPHRP